MKKPIPLADDLSRFPENRFSGEPPPFSRGEKRAAPLDDDLVAPLQEFIWEMGRIAERRKAAGDNHVVRIGLICRALAETMGLEPARIETLTLAAPLHDIGMMGIPERVFLKKEGLSPAETAVLRWHCWIGAKILRDEPALKTIIRQCRSPEKCLALLPELNPIIPTAVSISLAHHERWDGSGYPRELQGEEIPLEARIVALADVYDALTSDRPHRRAYSEEWALEALDESAGKHFDPRVHSAFLTAFSEIHSLRLQYPDTP